MNNLNFFKKSLIQNLSIILLFFLVNLLILIGYLVFNFYYFSREGNNIEISSDQIAEDFNKGVSEGEIIKKVKNANAFYFILDQNGNIIKEFGLPKELNHKYSLAQVASFTRWYLDDYPVFTQILNNQNLLVIGLFNRNIFRYNLYMPVKELFSDLLFYPLILIGNLILCLYLAYRHNRSLKKELEPVFSGIEDLSKGKVIDLVPSGKLSQVKEALNKSSRILKQKEDARTNWITNISHDIRTPLMIILSSSEMALDKEKNKTNQEIFSNAVKIKELIEKLNLDNKLSYGNNSFEFKKLLPSLLIKEIIIDYLNKGEDLIELETSDTESILINPYLFNILIRLIIEEFLEVNSKVKVIITQNKKGIETQFIGTKPIKQKETRIAIMNQEIINKILELHHGEKFEENNEMILKFYKN